MISIDNKYEIGQDVNYQGDHYIVTSIRVNGVRSDGVASFMYGVTLLGPSDTSNKLAIEFELSPWEDKRKKPVSPHHKAASPIIELLKDRYGDNISKAVMTMSQANMITLELEILVDGDMLEKVTETLRYSDATGKQSRVLRGESAAGGQAGDF